MSTLEINSKDFVKLKDKVILITGIEAPPASD
ncbi:hypothetical protein CGCSCA4_v012295 [Colletotrichum siamense]|uniref:Uncharacterized protein n=1 Tax=Colletotrichum siamense TaxID=690259 RepID=A0A9P5BY01_COLSI|nr:hypothetical protein CGCSCA5_v011232 [Colletotrichum siamense]KAF4814080.1 hypothetical protein CGCTS75_v013500 [Colletotrichum tropicale]KAF4882486.1 hypothetical protein CGCFRS4_v014525 [Colletotrichum fructicola]KAF4836783.1 hypothetical protein CGCSCA4_v012295 [Colletotrichum siamense]KAF4850714.1 hypothetical protein CGCSCA2_v011386 [Colletotrichum siamense]